VLIENLLDESFRLQRRSSEICGENCRSEIEMIEIHRFQNGDIGIAGY
jgi:hypothetical protein